MTLTLAYFRVLWILGMPLLLGSPTKGPGERPCGGQHWMAPGTRTQINKYADVSMKATQLLGIYNTT